MNKMREAFEVYEESQRERVAYHGGTCSILDFEAGYCAAIDAVKEGGPVLERLMPDPFDERDGYWWDTTALKKVKVGDKLYKLPEDKP